MPQTVTDAEVGTEIAADGILAGITLTSVPKEYGNDYFCLTDGEEGPTLFNMHIQTSPVTAGSVLMANDTVLFKNLFVKSIPPGATFDLEFGTPPTFTGISPDTAVSGDPDFVLSCTGTGLSGKTVIVFGSHDEPTTLVSDTEVTTGVKPSLFAPAVVPVYLRHGPFVMDPVDFTFTEPVVVEENPPAA